MYNVYFWCVRIQLDQMMDYSSSNSYISEFEFDNSEYSERPYKRLRFERYKVEADVHSVLTRRNKITCTRTCFGR